MLKIKQNKMVRWVLFLALIIPVSGITGCNWEDWDDDDSLIVVCNHDDEEYEVRLHRESNGSTVDEFYLEEWYDGDSCDEFKDFEGRYYLTIHEDGQEHPTDTSASFYIDKDETENFHIDSTGDIERD